MSRWQRIATFAAIAVALTVDLGCGGGGGGGGGNTGGGPTNPPPPPRSLSWTVEAEATGEAVFLDVRDLSNVDRFVLQVRVTGMSDLYGVGFDLGFPSDIVSFDPAATGEGNFLPADGAFDTELQIVEAPAGNLIVGYSRVGGVNGRNGSGLLLNLEFTTTASGSGNFVIDRELAVDRDGKSVGADWLSGEIQVQR